MQTDIKRVLAYSTISQLGYMFAAVGVGAYAAGIFHLVTHAFFKALLFLGAGSVIHGLHGEQDLRKMGGLASQDADHRHDHVVGGLGLAGLPPLAGFFSKDEILAAALDERPLRCMFVLLLARRLHDRLLHVPPALPRLLRRAADVQGGGRTTSTSRPRS